MSQTMHTLALEILKSKHNLNQMAVNEIHAAYRSIYSELSSLEKEYVKSHPDEKLLV